MGLWAGMLLPSEPGVEPQPLIPLPHTTFEALVEGLTRRGFRLARAVPKLMGRGAFLYIWCVGDRCEAVSNVLVLGFQPLYVMMAVTLTHMHQAVMRRFEKSDGVWSVLVILPEEEGYHIVYVSRRSGEKAEALAYIIGREGLAQSHTTPTHT